MMCRELQASDCCYLGALMCTCACLAFYLEPVLPVARSQLCLVHLAFPAMVGATNCVTRKPPTLSATTKNSRVLCKNASSTHRTAGGTGAEQSPAAPAACTASERCGGRATGKLRGDGSLPANQQLAAFSTQLLPALRCAPHARAGL